MSKKQLSYTLFTEKYRPDSVSGVLMPGNYRRAFQKFVKDGEVPNLLLYSSYPGSGKTSLAKALCNDIDAHSLYFNMSEDSGIDVLRNDIRRFASGKSLDGKKKIVILDELDQSNSQNLQKGLRGFIEEFQNVCRFIATCNHVNKVIPPLRSRFQEFDFNMNSESIRKEMIPKVFERVLGMLKAERIEHDPDIVRKLVEEKFPDIRKIFTLIQQYSSMNGIVDINIFNFAGVDEQLYEYILNGKFTMARKFIAESGYNYDDLYGEFYRNLIPKLPPGQIQALITRVIGEWNYKAALCTDKEIPLMACVAEIMAEIAGAKK